MTDLNALGPGPLQSLHTEEEWFDTYLAHATGAREDLIPFPSDDVQVITNSAKGEHTARAAIAIWKTMYQSIQDVADPARDWSVLDYGCGWGRITRLLPYYFEAAGIHGADVDARLVESANALLPAIRHRQIKSMDTLPYEDEAFDLVFANSVFSHLSQPSATYTLGELSRLLKPGGVLLISVLQARELSTYYEAEATRAWITGILGERRDAEATLDQDGFVWGDTRRWDNYGITIVSDAWLERAFSDIGVALATSSSGAQNYKLGIKQ
ncbi:MAG: class I SAM-dependent methyltransferase [Pseudomonadota bacterium]